MNRGEVVRVADGKPRPAVIVQSDYLPTPTMILICPLSSAPSASPIYRVMIEPDGTNGLLVPSQCMVDRVGPVRRDRIGGVIGRLSHADMQRLDVTLVMMLDLAR